MAAGDHLKVSRKVYWHHAIDLGNGSVVQYTAEPLRPGEGRIGSVSMDEFLDGGTARIVTYKNPAIVDDILNRARSRLAECDYSIPFNNCEHFATWCVTGKMKSGQVQYDAGAAAGLLARSLIARTAGAFLPMGGPILAGLTVGYGVYKLVQVARRPRAQRRTGARVTKEDP